ncbi:uncharacterized protein LOC128546392 [Mercenaria mercenaria]|uniref:uncharacterized protein LOC128546392 n=1 Tax=Mercenaria mercenaria TaxID=6596 RepID=UPI00234F506D|nr:uncharacterized protein LOC128546392 [Mercenaria mercenaria]
MGPVFGVSDYWYRQEFAKLRGMVHWHGLCWRQDRQPHNLLHAAVQEGLSDSMCAERLAKWASSEISLSAMHPAGSDSHGHPRKNLWPPPEGSAPAPDEEKNPLVKLLMDVSSLEDYLLLTNRVSLHRCSDYCLRTKQSNSSSSRVCRMDFGTENNPGKHVHDHAEIVKDRNRSLRLEMPRDHPALVQNSRYHTQVWWANGDISFILSKSNPENLSVDEILATEKYITGYACKGNEPTGAMADLFNDIVNSSDEESATGKSVCRQLLMNTVKRDVSAAEVSFELSSLPLYRCSYSFQNISLSGCRVLEKNGSTATKNTALDNYLSRDENDISSFYQFVCNRGRVPVLAGNNARASWPLDDNYCRSMLILHWPNRRKIEQIKTDKTWTEIMHAFLNTEACPNFLKADVERAKKKYFENVCYNNDDDTDSNSSTTNDDIDSPDWVELICPNQITDFQSDFKYDDGGPDYDWSAKLYAYPIQKCQDWIENINQSAEVNVTELILPDVDLNMINSNQKFAFDITMLTLSNYVKNDTDFEPLRLIVSGTAGTGKSFLIKCLVKAIRSLFQTNKSVQVVCPTGNSANIISGVTLHSYLKVPTKKRGKDMTPPDGTIGECLQSNCEGLEALLVDERSLIGTNTLGWMEYMCRHGVHKGSKSHLSWGGLPVVIFFGDDVQLPPVLDSPVYNNKSQSPASRHEELVWQDFQYAVTLSTIVRQSADQKNLRDLLMAIREYKATPQQALWLQRFQWKNLQNSYGDELLNRMSENGLFVFPCHEEEWQHNKLKLLEANTVHPVAKLNAICHGPHSKSEGQDKSGGIQQTLFLCKKVKVMLSINLCVPYGLFNGASGTVIDIIYEADQRPSNALPKVVFVEFLSYTGPAFLPENPNIVPIVPVERKVDCRRTQIPLRLGLATVVHRCQGMALG